MKFALLGLPGAGKKTFFSLLTERSGDEREMPVTLHGLLKRKGVRRDGDAFVGSAPIYDKRLETLTRMFNPEKMVPAENNVVLCPDVGASDKKWIEAAKHCDLLCVLLRDFSGDDISCDSVDAAKDKSTIETEIILADLEMVENRLSRLAKEKRVTSSAQCENEKQTLVKIQDALEKQRDLFPIVLEAHESALVKSLGLMTLKPILWVCNVDENRIADESESLEFRVSCLIEREIMGFDSADERNEYLNELGLSASGLDRLNMAAYNALGLLSFYTVGKDEVRAWTIVKGSTAPRAAGKIHSDIERGFIRVEVIKYDDLITAGSEAAAKAAGAVQLKGKDYIISDGDICHFLFNV